MPGVVGVYTYEDVPKRRFTIAGQSYPQPSPYDRLILENLVRYQNEEWQSSPPRPRRLPTSAQAHQGRL